MPFRKDQKSLNTTGNLKGGTEIATAPTSRTGPGFNKKGFLDITTLIRSIQSAEGNTDCFQKGIVNCDQLDCKWRSLCLEEQQVLRKDEA